MEFKAGENGEELDFKGSMLSNMILPLSFLCLSFSALI
jgi:hypothetical protein